MKRVHISVKQMKKFEGQWVAIDSKKEQIIAVGETFDEIAPFVSGLVKDRDKLKAYSFKVPRKDEGPYILTSK